MRAATVPPRGPDEGEVAVYLQPLEGEAARLALSFAAVALVRSDGGEVPLSLAVRDAAGARQRRIAHGRVPSGQYVAANIRIERATVETGERPADLHVAPEPVRVDAAFRVLPGRAVLVQLQLSVARSEQPGFGFAPSFFSAAAGPGTTQSVGYATAPGSDLVTVFDRRTRQVTGLVATGARPRGVAFHPLLARAYVAISGEDRIEVLDVVTGEPLASVRLQGGDRPEAVALTRDGRTMLVLAPGSDSLVFVDVDGSVEVGRVTVGEGATSLVVDGADRRAYVLNRRASTVTVVDLASQSVAATISTDAEPHRAALSARGDRLYVVHRGSAYLTIHTLPDLAPAGRLYVGLGAAAVFVDPRTDLLYVSLDDDPRLQVYDPLSLVPVHHLDVGGTAADLAMDRAENVLFALVPERRDVAVVDLGSRRTVARLDMEGAPFDLALLREGR